MAILDADTVAFGYYRNNTQRPLRVWFNILMNCYTRDDAQEQRNKGKATLIQRPLLIT